jgi:hypothetical protein
MGTQVSIRKGVEVACEAATPAEDVCIGSEEDIAEDGGATKACGLGVPVGAAEHPKPFL